MGLGGEKSIEEEEYSDRYVGWREGRASIEKRWGKKEIERWEMMEDGGWNN